MERNQRRFKFCFRDLWQPAFQNLTPCLKVKNKFLSVVNPARTYFSQGVPAHWSHRVTNRSRIEEGKSSLVSKKSESLQGVKNPAHFMNVFSSGSQSPHLICERQLSLFYDQACVQTGESPQAQSMEFRALGQGMVCHKVLYTSVHSSLYPW